MQFIQTSDDRWQLAGPEASPRPAGHQLLTLAQWHAVRGAWPADLPTGVILDNTVDAETLADDLPRLALVALQFPKWIDGRAYSQAHVLRARLRYAGEIRAVGEVVVDMLPLLQRTGFSAVQLRAGEQEASARRALEIVSDHYQGDVVRTRPLFSRIAA